MKLITVVPLLVAEGSADFTAVTTLVGNVISLAGTVLTAILAQPILAIGIGASIVITIVTVIRKLRRA